jgi:diadenosine tetraphosphatase ApaH/serine/threonine PP2A family protein phosphatase
MDRDLGLWRVVNPGSVGMPKDKPHAAYALVAFDGETARIDLRRVVYDLEAAIADLQTQEHPYWQEIADTIRGVSQP